jgi:Mg2+-importing ATPase
LVKQYSSEFWSIPASELLQRLETTSQGLTSDEAKHRLTRYGANLMKPKKRAGVLFLFLVQFRSPIILILLGAAVLSFFVRDSTDALIILGIIILSSLLGFWQEHRATNAVERLLARVQIKTAAIRDGEYQEIFVEDVVPGDIVTMKAGDVVPADCLILESKDLFADEATLTGETFPADKAAETLPPETPLARRRNCLFMGTHIVSGTGVAVVVLTGKDTEFGKISETLKLRPPETEFERGVHRFGYFLMEITLLLVVAIFAINIYLTRPILDSFLFSLALAVGLTPQLLPAIISVNLAHGAQRLARERVIVRRLSSIENFGSMNVLCSDKTGTITEGVMRLHSALSADGEESEKVRLYSYLNAFYETGFQNPIDDAIRSQLQFDISTCRKLDEVPYDFERKRLSVLVSKDDVNVMITKGAVPNVLAVCSSAEISDGTIVNLDVIKAQAEHRFQDLSDSSYRVLGLAYRNLNDRTTITGDYEDSMTFLGLIVFFDPPKPQIVETIRQLKNLGISLKIVSGDNRLVVKNLGQQLGLATARVVTGPELRQMSSEALRKQVTEAELFGEVEPNQKERIIVALKQGGAVVGFLGDGINDAPALHAADVGISVDSAVDVAKEAADIVLLQKDLGVLTQGVKLGRTTFANTLKYVFMATSANFGNMFSMAGASLFLSFLPMLPRQVLLINLMTDFPEMTISTDNVDAEFVEGPHRWNITFIRRFMLTFGLLSTVFDFATFGVLLLVLNATVQQFRTGWFLESVVSACLIVLVIRSRRPFFRSRPGKYLLVATIGIVAVVLVLPFTNFGRLFGFATLPIAFLLFLFGIVVLYIVSAEIVKKLFYKRVRL